MPEAYSWPEGSLWWSTGTPFSTSAGFPLVKNTDATFNRGWVNTPAAGGVYYNHSTGQRVDIAVGAAYSFDKTAMRWFDSATAVHMKFLHSSVNGSAGFFVYSGVIQSIKPIGSEGQIYTYTLSIFANTWSSF